MSKTNQNIDINFDDDAGRSMGKLVLRWVLLSAVAAMLVACGGGGGGAQTSGSISGVAAVGAPMSGASIYLIDSAGRTIETVSDSAGAYSFSAGQTSGLQAPVLLVASVQLGERKVNHFSLVEVLEGDVIANITPLSSAIVALLSDAPVLSPLTQEQLAGLTSSQIELAKNKVKSAVKPLSDQMVSGVFDPISTPIFGVGEGVDELLDHIELTVGPNTVALMNKMSVLGDSTSSATSNTVFIEKTSSDLPTGLPADRLPTAALGELYSQFVRCFTLQAADRLVVQSSSNATLDPACSDIALADYKHNGLDFKARWARALKSSDIKIGEGARFYFPEVRLAVSDNPLRLAVNFNFLDNTGAGYTVPEIIEYSPSDLKWRLRGNGRKVNVFIDANANYYADMSRYPEYVNLNTSKVESGIQVYFDPRVVFDSAGEPEYNLTDYTTTSGLKDPSPTYNSIRDGLPAGKSMVGCIVVIGPGRFTTPENTRWMGMFPYGTVMKRPSGSTRQDYMAFSSRLNATQHNQLINSAVNEPVDSNICGNGVTDESASFYAFEIEPLSNQINPITGVLDTGINGRPAVWNLGVRYARTAPDRSLRDQLDSKPVFSVYVIDTGNKLRMKINTRYLGEIPTTTAVKYWHDQGYMAKFKPSTLEEYLSFDSGRSNSNTQSSISAAEWQVTALGFAPDLVGFYSQIYQGEPGNGLRDQDPLWTSDPDLAVQLTGYNFWHRNHRFAKLKGLNGACGSKSLVSSNSIAVKRSDRSFASPKSLGEGNPYYGLDSLDQDACLTYLDGNNNLQAANYRIESYVYREVWNRTYTGHNVRLYYLAANRKLKQ